MKNAIYLLTVLSTLVATTFIQENEKVEPAQESPYRLPVAHSYVLTTTTFVADQETKSVNKVLMTPTMTRTESETNGARSIIITDVDKEEVHSFMELSKKKVHFISQFKPPTEEQKQKAAALSTWKEIGKEDEVVKWEETTEMYTAIHWLRSDGVPVKAEITYKSESGGAKMVSEWTEFEKLDEEEVDPKLFDHPKGYKTFSRR